MHEERWTGEEMKAKIQETIMAYNEGFAGQVAKVTLSSWQSDIYNASRESQLIRHSFIEPVSNIKRT